MAEERTYTVQLETTERAADEAALTALAQYLAGHQVLRDAALGLTPAGALTVTCQVRHTNVARAVKVAHEELAPLLSHWATQVRQDTQRARVVLVRATEGLPE